MDFDELKEAIAELAVKTVGDFVDQAQQDFSDFVADTKEKLAAWTKAAAEGLLSKDEFTMLVRMRAANAEMHALPALGIGQTRLERFRQGVISILVLAVSKSI